MLHNIILHNILSTMHGVNNPNVYFLADGRTVSMPVTAISNIPSQSTLLYQPFNLSEITSYSGLNKQNILNIYNNQLNNNKNVLKVKLKFLCSRF